MEPHKAHQMTKVGPMLGQCWAIWGLSRVPKLLSTRALFQIATYSNAL